MENINNNTETEEINIKEILFKYFAFWRWFVIGVILSLFVAFTYLLAPIGLVLLTESFQPIFVFMLGIFFTFFIPKVATEKIYARHILQKVLAIFITAIGTYLLLK